MVKCSPVDEQRWGSITRLTPPGGGKVGVYQPKQLATADDDSAVNYTANARPS
jgi:hypothetical protein